MRALFVELPAFERHRRQYLDDGAYAGLQQETLRDPASGDAITGTGGLRKLRYGDSNRGKGKRGGLRVIYFWWERGRQFWLFTIYAKDEVADLTPADRKALKLMIKQELAARGTR